MVVNATPRPLFPWEGYKVPIVQEAGWTPEHFWTGAENLAPAGLRSTDRPTRNDSLYRLSYPDPSYNSIVTYRRKCSIVIHTS